MKAPWPSAMSALVLIFGPAPLPGEERNPGDEAVLKVAGLTSDGPALVRFFEQHTLTEAEQARLATEARRLGADSFRERERAMRELRAAGRSALPFVRPAVNHSDPEVARRAERLVRELEGGRELPLMRAAARLLADRRPAGTTEVVLRFLPSADDGLLEDELMAVLAVVASSGGRIDPAVTGAVKDSAAARRGAAAWVLGGSSRADERAMARLLLVDLDPTVRFRAARALLAAREKEAVPALAALLSDASPAIGWEVEEILFRLAGERAPAVALGEGSETERR